MHQVKKLVINWLRLVKTGNWFRLVQDHKKLVLSGLVWFFDLLGLWWTGLSLSPCPRKAKTGLDQTSKHYKLEKLHEYLNLELTFVQSFLPPKRKMLQLLVITP